jgi:hypothetical protein
LERALIQQKKAFEYAILEVDYLLLRLYTGRYWMMLNLFRFFGWE